MNTNCVSASSLLTLKQTKPKKKFPKHYVLKTKFYRQTDAACSDFCFMSFTYTIFLNFIFKKLPYGNAY